MATELFRRGVRDHRRALLGWCVGIAGYIALVASIFPSIESSPELNELIERYPDALKSLQVFRALHARDLLGAGVVHPGPALDFLGAGVASVPFATL